MTCIRGSDDEPDENIPLKDEEDDGEEESKTDIFTTERAPADVTIGEARLVVRLGGEELVEHFSGHSDSSPRRSETE